MEEPSPLTPEEAETLRAIVEGAECPKLRTAELVRLVLRRPGRGDRADPVLYQLAFGLPDINRTGR